MTLDFEDLDPVHRQVYWLWVELISHGQLLQTESLPDVLILTERLVVHAAEVVLVSIKELVFALLLRLASRVDSRGLGHLDNDDIVLLTLLY